MKRCRSLWAGLAVLALGYLAAPASAVDPRYLPSDTEIIFTVNLQQILNSPLVKSQKDAEAKLKDMVKQSPQGEQVVRYLKKADFDVFKDLKSLTLAAPGTGDPKGGLLVLEGNFNEAKILEVAKEAAADSGKDFVNVKNSGARRYLAITPPDETKHAYVSVVAPGVLVAASTEDGLKTAWSRASGSAPGGLKKEVQDLLATVDGKQSLTFVATGPALAKMLKEAPVPNAQKAVPVIETLEAITASIAIGKDVDFQLTVGMQDAATAKQFAQQAVIGLAVAKEMVKQKASEDKRLEPAVDVVNSIRASADNTNLIVRGVITGEAIDQLIKSNLKD